MGLFAHEILQFAANIGKKIRKAKNPFHGMFSNPMQIIHSLLSLKDQKCVGCSDMMQNPCQKRKTVYSVAQSVAISPRLENWHEIA